MNVWTAVSEMQMLFPYDHVTFSLTYITITTYKRIFLLKYFDMNQAQYSASGMEQ